MDSLVKGFRRRYKVDEKEFEELLEALRKAGIREPRLLFIPTFFPPPLPGKVEIRGKEVDAVKATREFRKKLLNVLSKGD